MIQPGGQPIEQRKTSYDWTYEYGSTHPHAPTHLGERTYRYDANGNQLGWDNDRNGTRRNIVWDEENRIQSVFDNGHEKSYKYDDQGERVIKRGPQGETAYVNQWYTVRNREVASKHVWAGTTRVATSLVPGVKGVGATAPSTETSTTPTTTGSRLPTGAQQAPGILAGQGVNRRSQQAAQNSRNQEKNPHYATEGTPVSGPAPGTGTATNQDNFLYYYHPDHLGSSSYVTDADGKVYEHLEYFPFGETWVQESSNIQRTPYLFTGKELDEETGLYYFGARYYDPRVSVWQSPDRILERYLPEGVALRALPGMGGVANTKNLSLYSYGHQNPVKYTDPDGNVVKLFTSAIKLAVKGGDVYSTVAGIVDNAKVIASPAASIGEKMAAAADIALDVGTGINTKDIKATAQVLEDAKDKIRSVSSRASKTEVHHVVPQSDKRAAEARDVMKSHGINPKTDSANKVALPGDKHDITKRDSYVRDTNQRIAAQPDADGIRAECCRIADNLRNSTTDELSKQYPSK